MLRIHIISQVANAIDLYSASTDYLENVFYFILFQDIKLPLTNIQHPETDLLVIGYLAQSESEKAATLNLSLHLQKLIPFPRASLRYFNTLKPISK